LLPTSIVELWPQPAVSAALQRFPLNTETLESNPFATYTSLVDRSTSTWIPTPAGSGIVGGVWLAHCVVWPARQCRVSMSDTLPRPNPVPSVTYAVLVAGSTAIATGPVGLASPTVAGVWLLH
jgi:hypothetical protein